MTDTDVREGTIPFTVSSIATPCHTYYKIIGDPSSPSPRLVILHGGPGTGHEYLLPFRQLWEQFQIPVVLYDQIGCARSTHLPETAGDESFWQESLFINELDNLLDSLGLRDGPGFHILGHSWGGRLVAAFAATRPRGLKRLVIASGIASTETFLEGLKRIRKDLPPDAQLAMSEGEETGNVKSPEFQKAMDVFFRLYFCRAEPFPPKELLPAFKNMSEDTTVRDAISGASPLNCTGSFRDWTCIPRLHQISVPTLLYNGEFDTSHKVTLEPFFQHIPRIRWVTFPNAGHMCHLERPEVTEKIFRLVGEFLTQDE